MSANAIMGDPNITSDGHLRRDLRRDVVRTTMVNVRHDDGTVKPASLAQARAQLKGKRGRGAAPTAAKGGRRVDHTPPNINFTRSAATPRPIADDKRKRRNQLSAMPMDPNSDGMPAAVAKEYDPSDRLTYPKMDIFSNKLDTSMMKRIRKRGNKKFHSKDTSPKTKRRAGRVVQAVIDKDKRVESAIEDLEPTNSQEGYDYAEECVKTQGSK
jgi:hypothetical protein